MGFFAPGKMLLFSTTYAIVCLHLLTVDVMADLSHYYILLKGMICIFGWLRSHLEENIASVLRLLKA